MSDFLYQVEVSEQALMDIKEQCYWLRKKTHQHADLWYDKVFEKIEGLKLWPLAHPIAEESAEHKMELRKLSVGSQVVLFTVDESQKRVRVVTVRGGAQRHF